MNATSKIIGVFTNDAGHLSMIEMGAYFMLLDRYLAIETGIADEHRYRVTKAKSSAEKKAVDHVLSSLFKLVDGVWKHADADKVISSHKQRAEISKNNGCKNSRHEKSQLNQQQTPTQQLPSSYPAGINESSNVIPVKPKTESAIAFKTFLERCKELGEKPVSNYTPVWEYAEKVGLSEDAVVLCWQEFNRRYNVGGISERKKYANWRIVFRKCVEGNWFGLWTMDDQGRVVMTTKGRMAERATA